MATAPKSKKNPKTEFYFEKSKKWHKELQKLRTIVLGCDLSEELKWGCPCYTLQNTNIVLLHVFKDYCAVLFFKGVLLQDPENILVQQTKNVQAGRHMRFTNAKEIAELQATIRAYILEAIEVEKQGLKVELKKTSAFEMPEEFLAKLEQTPNLQAAFDALTPGRQRGYLLHFAGAKQSKTREARIEKYLPKILAGLGIDD